MIGSIGHFCLLFCLFFMLYLLIRIEHVCLILIMHYCLMVHLPIGLLIFVVCIKGILSLSPYLFIICYVFFCLLKMTVSNQLLKAYYPRDGLAISHVFFANDCLLIARITLHNAIMLAIIFYTYFFHSG